MVPTVSFAIPSVESAFSAWPDQAVPIRHMIVRPRMSDHLESFMDIFHRTVLNDCSILVFSLNDSHCNISNRITISIKESCQKEAMAFLV